MAGVREGVQRVGGNSRFEDLPKPLGIVSADIASGREVIFTRGLLWPAVLASMAIPGIYPPQRIGEHILVDGGVLKRRLSLVACSARGQRQHRGEPDADGQYARRRAADREASCAHSGRSLLRGGLRWPHLAG